MELVAGWGDEGFLVVGRCCLAVVFAVSASNKFCPPDEVKILSNLHVPAPATAELLVGVFETVGVIALVFGIYAAGSQLPGDLHGRCLVCSVVVLVFADPPPARAQKLNGFVANIAIVGGLIYVVVVGPGRFSFVQ